MDSSGTSVSSSVAGQGVFLFDGLWGRGGSDEEADAISFWLNKVILVESCLMIVSYFSSLAVTSISEESRTL
ncbi:uncharacterized protein OCT59_020097 [Rhizophagus irregularis]|uniref:uncharacterized protein n=1 Tax=Rhizophagus irregularis TaxID=588596 RepID=UPI00333388CD|nr:hypothetical protein OCT59_020097 [Rhizophagus irregularis]